MTAPHHPPADHTDDDARPDAPRRPRLDLSLTQLLGGALAAATGAAVASQLGVAGTILGAAAISLVSAIGGAAYTHSLRQTRERVRAVAGRTRPRTENPTERPAQSPDRRGPGGTSPRLVRVRTMVAGAAAVFAVAFAAITGYELLTGEPLSGDAGRTTLTTLTGGDEADTTDTPDRPAPTSAVPTSETPPVPPASSGPPATSSAATTSPPPSTGPPTSAPSAPATPTDPTVSPSTPPSPTPTP